MSREISTFISTLLNAQIQKEFESAYIYLGFAAFFEQKGLSGFAKWYKIQAREEESHAMKFYDYLCRTDQKIDLLPINAPQKKPESIDQTLKAGLVHEEYVTGLISNIYFQAEKENDLFTLNFLEWFITEQLEEEENARTLITKYEIFGSTPEGLYALDKELSQRK